MLSSISLQTLTLCSIKSCKNRTLSVLAWVYYFLMGATPRGLSTIVISLAVAPDYYKQEIVQNRVQMGLLFIIISLSECIHELGAFINSERHGK